MIKGLEFMEDNTGQNGVKSYCESDDEINLADYCLVLWKRKVFILLATILPAVCVAVALLLLPKNYTVTYVYDASNWGLTEKNYTLLLNRFYSGDNLTRLTGKLRQNGLEAYAKALGGSAQPENFVKLEAVPAFFDISQLKTVAPEQLDTIKAMKASLLNVTILGNPAEKLYPIASVIRDNIKDVIPLYVTQEQLSASIREYNNMLADIESNRFSLGLALKHTNEILAGLRKVNTIAFDVNRESVVLQFNVGEQNEYLPLSYQIQAAESKRIGLEENVKTTEKKYGYYKDLVELNSKILMELDARLSSDYTVEQFKAFLVGLLGGTEKSQLKDYLNSYIRTIENKISANRPVTEKPKIISVAKGMVKKTAIVLAACLMLSVFAAFLKESIEKNKARLL
jgi:hypothetical protein